MFAQAPSGAIISRLEASSTKFFFALCADARAPAHHAPRRAAGDARAGSFGCAERLSASPSSKPRQNRTPLYRLRVACRIAKQDQQIALRSALLSARFGAKNLAHHVSFWRVKTHGPWSNVMSTRAAAQSPSLMKIAMSKRVQDALCGATRAATNADARAFAHCSS